MTTLSIFGRQIWWVLHVFVQKDLQRCSNERLIWALLHHVFGIYSVQCCFLAEPTPPNCINCKQSMGYTIMRHQVALVQLIRIKPSSTIIWLFQRTLLFMSLFCQFLWFCACLNKVKRWFWLNRLYVISFGGCEDLLAPMSVLGDSL